MAEINVIRIAAAVITDKQQRMLLVRKKNTRYFMQPGGKIEPQESAQIAVIRELQEELGVSLEASQLKPMGEFTDIAANEPGYIVQATLFRHEQPLSEVAAAAEIEEVRWVSREEASTVLLAPLTKNIIIPRVWGVVNG
ncbi:NUDIX hydrolase [Tatumella sp. UBA2305]|uniref:NUDIX hydrolase n=1 Tax=Tatumella sp. UBA2305 TaxID=1947647 RepID=UPI0025F7477D|nr:NUDIX domain-containing protein [Tatumella sp. UBA2305]